MITKTVDQKTSNAGSKDDGKDRTPNVRAAHLQRFGTFGKVYQMSAVPWSAAGEVAPETVAVQVMSKMEETRQEQAQLAKHVG